MTKGFDQIKICLLMYINIFIIFIVTLNKALKRKDWVECFLKHGENVNKFSSLKTRLVFTFVQTIQK